MADSCSYYLIILVYIYLPDNISLNVVSGFKICERRLGEREKKLCSDEWPCTILELQDSMDRQEFI